MSEQFVHKNKNLGNWQNYVILWFWILGEAHKIQNSKKHPLFFDVYLLLSKQENIFSKFCGLFWKPEVYLIAMSGQTHPYWTGSFQYASMWLSHKFSPDKIFRKRISVQSPRLPDDDQIGQKWGTTLKKCSCVGWTFWQKFQPTDFSSTGVTFTWMAAAAA